MDDLIEIPPDQARYLAKNPRGRRIDLQDAERVIHQIDADGCLVEKRFELGAGFLPQSLEVESRFDAGDKFSGGERFRQVVIRTRADPFGTRLLSGSRRKQDDRHLAQLRYPLARRRAGQSRRDRASSRLK